MFRLLVVCPLIFAWACGDSRGPARDALPDAPPPSHLFAITRELDFVALASTKNEVKFLLRGHGNLPGDLASQACVFANTRQYELHLQFLRSRPELAMYSAAMYSLDTATHATRKFIPGSLFWVAGAVHPDGGTGVMAYTYSVDSREGPKSIEEWSTFGEQLRQCVSYPSSELVLIGVDPTQEAYLLANQVALRRAGITVVARAQLSQKALEVYSPGESYGYLNVVGVGVPPTDYGPRDIVVTDAASDDITTVAGLITTFPQSFGSHLNVRLREKQLPNLRWVGVRSDPRVAALTGQLVHLRVNDDGSLVIEAAALAAAEAFWRARQPRLPSPRADLAATEFKALSALRHRDAIAYGVKAANLGELTVALASPHSPSGFAIPFSAYDQHLRANGLLAALEQLLRDPQITASRAYRDSKLKAFRNAISAAPLPAATLEEVTAALRRHFGAAADRTFIRFRSSTNAEDLAEFSGAGLYESKTGCLADDLDGDTLGPSHCVTPAHRQFLLVRKAQYEAEMGAHPERTWYAELIADIDDDLTKEKPVANALRRVWRSVWTLRAFDERSFYGIDHRMVFMGVAVMPAMVMEQLEAVVFTNLDHSGTTRRYAVTTQVEDVGVVRPSLPTATPERMSFLVQGTSASQYAVVQRSSLSLDADLWSIAKREALAHLLIAVQRHFATFVYPQIQPLRLDVEVDVDVNGTIIVKQVRPYLGDF